MASDDEDRPAQPKTLAERIALLGLGGEGGARPPSRTAPQRPTSRASIDVVRGLSADRPATPLYQAGVPKPPIAPKPHRLSIQPRSVQGRATPQYQMAREAVEQQSSEGLGAWNERQDREDGATDNEVRDNKPRQAISVKDRIQSLYRTQDDPADSTGLPQTPPSAASNPFASPDLSGTCDMAGNGTPVSPLPPLPSAVPVFARRATDASHHPMPSHYGQMLSPRDPRDTSWFSAGSTPLSSIGRADSRTYGLPPPPPPPPQPAPPSLHRPSSVLSVEPAEARHVNAHEHTRPVVPPKPASVTAMKSPPFGHRQLPESGRSQSISGPAGNGPAQTLRGGSLPLPPPPPPTSSAQRASLLLPPPPLPPPLPPPPMDALHLAQASAVSIGAAQSPVPHLPPPPLPPPPVPHAAGTGSHSEHPSQPTSASVGPASRQSSSTRMGASTLPSVAAASNTARTALDFSSDLSLKPIQPSYRLCNRRPPALGVQPFLSLEAATAPVLSCLGGSYSVVVHQSRIICTRVDTGDIGAIHNAPGPEERFVAIAPVHSPNDPEAECGRIWACTTLGRVLVLNTFNTGSYQEHLQAGSKASIVGLFSSGLGELWTLRDDGLLEIWQDRGADGSHDRPLVPLRSLSIAIEFQIARRASSQRSLLLLYQRELWFAGSRSIWVFDTHRQSEPLASVSASTLLSSQPGQSHGSSAPMTVVQLSLTTHDAGIICLASNVPFLDESRIEARGFVFAGTDAGHIIVWKAASYERWRTLDISNGERDVRINALACTSDRWLWIGLGTGKLLVVDIGPEPQPAAISCPLKLAFEDDAHAAVQRRDLPWAIVKEWQATDSAVSGIHVDWTPLLTGRRKLQVASVHASGSVFYWDGMLAMDCQYNELRRRTPTFARTRDVIVQINSWNIDAVKPEHLERSAEDRDFVKRWLGALGGGCEPELIVVGLQEVVDLESKKMTAKSLWKNTTSKHKNKNSKGTRKPGADISKRYGLWRRALEKALSRGMTFTVPYRIVQCQNMVGLFICVFARDDVYRSVREVDVSQVKTGMGGLHGNKGGIGVRFVLDDTSFCFVNAHLAAGESVNNNLARISHCATIVKDLSFRRPATEFQSGLGGGAPPQTDLANASLDAYVDGGDGQSYLDHAACFFSGDLNFRLKLGRVQAERYVAANEIEAMLQFDQLLPMIAADAAAAKGAGNASAGGPAFASSPASTALSVAPMGEPAPAPRTRRRSSSDSSFDSSGDDADAEDLENIGSTGFALRSFHEIPIQFHPTYKYDPGTDRYDTSEKRRVPAWCDRVLFRGGSTRTQVSGKLADCDTQGLITPLAYQRLECRQSDHRPIFAAFHTKVKTIDRSARGHTAAEIRRQYDSQVFAGAVYFAKALWLSRHTANMTQAGELLAHAQGDLGSALDALYR
ncbi:hypothetical protein GGF46_003848 [Coemansia sp. RSA 552]|nr:hypothetical protein GGF46_003848 [Coemansia sp. RSA 552]